jgi:hypothetical protein
VNRENVGLVFKRGDVEEKSSSCFISNSLIDFRSWSRPGMQGGDFIAPLYIYNSENKKTPNLKKEIWEKINESLTSPSPSKGGEEIQTTPENILDYIYAVLHSPKYRETYKEFLKIDFPRVPYPKDKKEFERLCKIGEKLRALHLMTDNSVNSFITKYKAVDNDFDAEDVVEKIKFEVTSPALPEGRGNVFINDKKYFEGVPEVAWNFFVGGYQPAQKYLKDRKGRTLTSDEIDQYQKIIKVLVETGRLMGEIDK